MLHDGEWRLVWVKLAKLETAADIPVVLITSLIFFDVGSEVRVDHADIRVVEAKTDSHSTLIALWINKWLRESSEKEEQETGMKAE